MLNTHTATAYALHLFSDDSCAEVINIHEYLDDATPVIDVTVLTQDRGGNTQVVSVWLERDDRGNQFFYGEF